MDNEKKMTTEELARYLDVEIRRRTRDRIAYTDSDVMGCVSGLLNDESKLRLKAHEVYDGIISSTSWDGNLLDATRSVKFSVAYVERVIKNAVKVGTIKFESATAERNAIFEEAHRVYAFEGISERQVAEAIADFIDATGEAKKPKLGTGERFAKLKASLAKRGATNPGALAAYIGRKKFGSKRFTKLSKAGAKRAKRAKKKGGKK